MSELYTPIPDAFEAEKPLQPKLAVAEYVESAGIRVPQRFADYQAAQHAAKNGLRVLARSEHPDEYAGPSGIGDTAQFKPDADGNYAPYYHVEVGDRAYRYYAKVWGGMWEGDYAALHSESYWQYVPGINITCVADDAIEGQYHVFGFRIRDEIEQLPTMYVGAIVNEDGSIVRTSNVSGKHEGFTSRYAEIIAFYNRVRRLRKFVESHCPIMELQLGAPDNELYFLQYHRGRDASPVTERLNPADYDERDGWIHADAVRGSYLGERALNLTIYYMGERRGANAYQIPTSEDGYTGGQSTNQMLDECIGRLRLAHIMPQSFVRMYETIAADHGPRSCMFKPQVSILTAEPRDERLIPADILEMASEYGYKQNHWVGIETEVAADGRDAYLRYGKQLLIA